MTSQNPLKIVYCGNLYPTKPQGDKDIIRLSYFDTEDTRANIRAGLSKFVDDIEKLPKKIIDLLEIAAYVFAADRSADRGDRSSLGNNAWARSFELHIPVRDYEFWKETKAVKKFTEALAFMTGDRKYDFHFEPYSAIPDIDPNHQLSLFADEVQTLSEAGNTRVMLFSGGLDSLAGAIDYLNNTQDKLLLVSHRANTTVTCTQNAIVNHLQLRYPGRIKTFHFECHFTNHTKSIEETQRTRMLLFSSIAFAICSVHDIRELYIYENGITSINLPKQADVFNARASRTTHPKTLALLEEGFRDFDKGFKIITPYWDRTKADILDVFKQNDELDILSSSVSCSSTRTKPQGVQHCGCCSQCIERKLAVYATGLHEYDAYYEENFILHFPDTEVKQRLYITLRMAAMEGFQSRDEFLVKFMNEIDDIVDYIPGSNPDDKVDQIFRLLCRSGDFIHKALQKMREQNESLVKPIPENSLLQMIANRDYLKSPIYVRVSELDRFLQEAIRTCFQSQAPRDERDLNDKIQALLLTKGDFQREYPMLRFANTVYQADHSEGDLLVEAKYIRGNTTPSVAAGGIAKDITEVPKDYGLFFIVYDPDHKIVSTKKYIDDFESKRDACYVRVYG
jgi:7-cyano-7-deazaguanine synthase in queuosine biosynthesis